MTVNASKLEERMAGIEASIAAILSEVTGQQNAGPVQHHIGTPLPATDADPMQRPHLDPWAAERMRVAGHMQAAAQEDLLDLNARAVVTDAQSSPFAGAQTGKLPPPVAPPMPQSFTMDSINAHLMMQAQTNHAELPPFTNPVTPTRPHAHVSFENYAPQHYQSTAHGSQWAGPGPMAAGVPSNFVAPPHQGARAATMEISRKKNESLKKFSGSINDFQIWRDRIVDHICRDNSRWRGLLESLQHWQTPITPEWLATQSECGYSA